jgi:ribosomal protein S18 acetylase RimI-like enzyme
MTHEIVPISHEHIESFHRALDFVARERRYLAFLEAPPLEEARGLRSQQHRPGLSASGRAVRGRSRRLVHVVPKARPVHAHVGVLGMALLPEFRGQGLGERLMREALDAARVFGLHRVELTVREDNKNAIALYRKIGFEVEGLMREAIKVDGVCQNMALMGLLL